MIRRGNWKKAFSVFMLCAATPIVSQAQTFKKLVDFNLQNGAEPLATVLVQGRDGNFYGTTYEGGMGDYCALQSGGCGTVFKMTPEGKLTTLHNFCSQSGCPDGSQPYAGLVLTANGDFYGTTLQYGANQGGTVFRITQEGEFTTLYNFCSQPYCTDGQAPRAPLVQASDGNLYGTTTGGGGGVDGGTVFRITRQGKLTTLLSFAGPDGFAPMGGLIQATDGNLYGTTIGGGTGACGRNGGCGTIFKITLKGELSTLYNFDEFLNGAYGPTAGLVEGTDGNFYGTSYDQGGNEGAVFSITPAGTFTVLHTFGYTDGAWPDGALVQGTDGLFYSTTESGGTYGVGTVFNISSSGALTTLYNFPDHDGCPFGCDPWGGLVQSTKGAFYGLTTGGGPDNEGTIYGLSTGLGPFVAFVNASGSDGQTGGILGQGFTGTTSVSLNGIPANFKVVSDTYLTATVPPGATTGYVTVTTPSGTLISNVPFHVIP
ncbi:MAG TPA: choice-of-anchor tandem repeat GloVer-containing protein [Terriglobales bacterium]|jgi:uncharacterized repeat protein (TIGR03803 family)|nr:choice-of-anchor tandem repeat GloVer-containing protein [Terriglobales bacterium]